MPESPGLLWHSEPPKKYRRVTVTTTVQYFVPIEYEDPEATEINGWPIEKVIQDWFEHHTLNEYHVTREAYRMGSTAKVQNIEIGPLEKP